MPVFSAYELATMRATQVDHMNHVAAFRPWTPAQDANSGQAVNTAAEQWQEIRCGIDFTAKGLLVDGSEGSFLAHYKIRLPMDMAAKARPLSRYRVTEAYLAPECPDGVLAAPLLLEQVSEPSIGPSGIVVWARNVTY